MIGQYLSNTNETRPLPRFGRLQTVCTHTNPSTLEALTMLVAATACNLISDHYYISLQSFFWNLAAM
jgi:hypothetical protein